MRLRLLEPASGNLETATFYCEQCGTETKREFVRDRKRSDASPAPGKG
jgi:hypothetical protein